MVINIVVLEVMSARAWLHRLQQEPFMSSLPRNAPPAWVPGRASVVWVLLAALAAEAYVLIDALLSPGQVIADVEHMRALQLEAQRVEADDPALAEELRWRASRIGLR